MTRHASTRPFKLSSVFLAISLVLLPALSTIHLVMVPHVYSVDHRHFHEIVTVFENGHAADCSAERTGVPVEPTGDLRPWSAELRVLEIECLLANLSLRNESLPSATVTFSGTTPAAGRLVAGGNHLGFSPPALRMAPKHSPPLSRA